MEASRKFKVFTIVSIRLCLGWIFFWAFIDKVFGLGFATESGKAWLDGVSPTEGYLSFGTSGPLGGFYQAIAGHPVTDVLFMAGLALVGLSLIFGVGLRIAGYAGALMMLLMWASVLPPSHNPLIDEHIVYGIVLVGIANSDAGRHFGLGTWWSKTSLVKRWKFLE